MPPAFPIELASLSQSDSAAVRELTANYLAALESQRAKEGLLAVAAHELRHPLHLMRMALARHLEDDADTRELLDRYIQRMTRLIDDLVDFIRTEQNTLELHREFVDIHEFLIALMDEYRTTFDARKVKLSVIAPVGVRVSADHHRLLQVFANLLDNALKFTPAGGAVTVEAIASERDVRIHVRDNGRGLTDDALRNLFDLPRTLANGSGMGIGLSVARRIAELHGGQLAVSSDGPGCGTEAVVTLPLAV